MQAQFDPSLVDRFGLGPEEAATIISYGKYTGTLGAMLTDERCPVGNVIESAYEKDGISGVEAQFGALSVMASDFSVTISARTRGFHEGSISRDELVVQPQNPEVPDFLAQ